MSTAKTNNRITLKSIEFTSPPFRKLGILRIEFADRITVIAGHNGIGKSTVLALIANGSGMSSTKEFSSYFIPKAYQGNLNDIIYLDPERDHDEYIGIEPQPRIAYDVGGMELVKRCDLVKRPTGDIRVVPRNTPTTADFVSGTTTVKGSTKVPLPTLYLGMTRALPVGEAKGVDSSVVKTVASQDVEFIGDFIQRVIVFDVPVSNAQDLTRQSVKGTKKTSLHPAYSHSSKCVSLGQDNVSAIATAFASFNKLKREMATYPGGLLVIDEIDAGLHPRAQEKLFQVMANEARRLDLQVVVTTHSLSFIGLAHPDLQPKAKRAWPDKVVYMTDTAAPRVVDYTFDQIRQDMMLTLNQVNPKSSTSELKVYLEDFEAELFLKALLSPALRARLKREANARLQIIGLGAGSENFKNYVKKDAYFRTVLIVLDGDAAAGQNNNVVALPGGNAPERFLSPERTLIQFLQSIVNTPPLHQATLTALGTVTTDYLRDRLLNDQDGRALFKGGANIVSRQNAKDWMKLHLAEIKKLKLFALWAAENPEKVKTFEDAFVKAASATVAVSK